MSDSDIEMKKIAPMKPVKKAPTSPTTDLLKRQEKKITTKLMIHEALTELKTRKGVSSYAIKKYLEEKYDVKTDKMKYLIKKTLKSGVEDGSIVQLKGMGASGSFKLAPVKQDPKKKPKPKKEKATVEKTTKEKSTKEKSTKAKAKEKPRAEKSAKEKSTKAKAKEKPRAEKSAKSDAKKMEKVKKVKIDIKDIKEKMKTTDKPRIEKEKKGKTKEVKEKAKGKMAAVTPAKKKAFTMKRKSVGSIIKPPKMRPKKA